MCTQCLGHIGDGTAEWPKARCLVDGVGWLTVLMSCQRTCSDVVGAVPPGPLWDAAVSTRNAHVSTFVQADSLTKGVRLVRIIYRNPDLKLN